ncbi:MAG: family 20 glycosylhydrolase [Anaerolineae bacterium]|nr:family 20 glycosylhydrolase [Anaerolineae bacterium]
MPKSAQSHPLSPCLVPEPRAITLNGGALEIRPDKLIVLKAAQPARGFFEAQEAQRALSQHARVTWHIHASDAVPAEATGLLIVIEDAAEASADVDRQRYALDVTPGGIRISASAPAGAFYAVMTLTQLLRQYGRVLPLLHIEDRPDFARRGVMLDISRDKVPTMQTLFELVDMLAELKINEFQLYTEHTFAYRRHPVVWASASPMTGEEIMQLDAYCRMRHIDLVPNQNCFGHMRRWLIHDAYRHLAECPNGCDTTWGYFAEPFTLCPGDPGSIALVEEIFEELLPHFTSRFFNVGCDETVDLGQGRSKAEVEARGAGRVYLDFLLKIYERVKRHGRTMQFWGDIIMAHPELVAELPRDVIAMEWGYEFDHPFADHGAKFAASGIPFYVCGGTSSWNSLGGRTDNAIGNLLNAAENGQKHGAIGFLNTDWGDYGHLQPLPISYLPYAYGAGVSWCIAANRDVDIARAVSLHLFGDPSGATGQFVYDLGNVYTRIPLRTHNGTAYAYGVIFAEEALKRRLAENAVERTWLKQVNKDLDRLEAAVPTLKMQRSDAVLIRREFAHVIHLMRYGVARLGRLGVAGKRVAADLKAVERERRRLVAEHDRVWLARNRPGGMEDSAANIRL